MATHDYVIANQSGAAFRTDLNNALAAIVSNNSNSSQPGTRYAYQWWADTSAGVMKIRNSANDGWIELFQLDGTLTLEAGSNSAPALAFRSDLNTGIYQSSADNLNFAAGGLERLKLGASTVFNDNGFDVDFIIETDTNSSMFFVDGGNNRISIGTSSPVSSSILEINASGNTSFSINTGNNSGDNSTINFGDSADADVGYINYDHGTNVLQIGVAAGLAATIDSSGRLLMGTTVVGNSSADEITIANSAACGITIRSGTSNSGNIFFGDGTSGNDQLRGFISYSHSTNIMSFGTNAETRFNLGDSDFTVFGASSGNAVPTVNLVLGILNSSGDSKKAQIESNKISDISSTIEFHTTVSHSFDERGRFHSGGEFMVGKTSDSNGAPGFMIDETGKKVNVHRSDGNTHVFLNKIGSTTTGTMMTFAIAAATKGSISVSTTATAYNTSSDYRLKENVVSISDGISKLKQLLPKRFNFIADKTNTLCDGFLAHEVSSIIPNAVTGEKDAVNKDGNIDPQQLDYSKIVPLLTAALQEAVSKLEVLETKVAVLEAA